ncbi:MAG: glycosyltransferase family 1 protein [Ilumatobacteraceae bacterium]
MSIDVAVNLTWMAPGRVGGSEQYLARQLLGLDATAFDLSIYCDGRFGAAYPQLLSRYRTSVMPGRIDSRVGRVALEHTWLAAKTRHADVVHHGGGTAPFVGARPVVLTVHDLQYLVHPAYFSAARRRYLGAMMPRSVARAAVIAVPTEFVRAHVIEAFGVQADRVRVVPHGVPVAERPTARTIEEVRGRHGVDNRPYVVYPAITHPHKRQAVLIDMLDHLDDGTALVLIGGEGFAESVVADTIARSPHAERVQRPGRVSDTDRDALVAGADALVFPSEFEGFGAPLVEAMMFDTPVVCSDAPAVVEVVGDAAVIVAEPSGQSWAAGVGLARSRRAHLVERGGVRREDFTIGRSGAALASAYLQAADS